MSRARRSRAQRALLLREIPPLVGLAIPVVAGLLGSTALAVVDTFMLGPLGELPLAATSLAQSVLVIFYAGLYGLTGAVGIHVGLAHGAGDAARISAALRHGLVLALAGGIVAAAIMAGVRPMLAATGQPAEVLAALPEYWLAMSALLVPFTVQMALKLFFESIGRPWMAAFFTLTPVLFLVPLNWLLIYGNLGFPALGLLGAGIANVVAVTLGVLITLLYVWRAQSMLPYRAEWHWSRSALGELARDGTPLAVQYLTEGTSVAIAGLLIGLLGATELAANQIVFSVGALVYMAPLGLAGAVMIRIAQAYGEEARHRIRPIGLAGILVVTSWMLGFTVLMVFFGEEIARLFVDEAPVIATAGLMFVAIGVMQVFDGLQSVSLGALRGILDTRWPTQVSLIAYWLIALPMCVVLGFLFDLRGAGIWAGFGIGIAVAGVLLLTRFLRLTRRFAP